MAKKPLPESSLPSPSSLGALTLLFFVTVSATDTQYYKHVDEVMTQPAQWYGKGMQLHGFVVDELDREAAEHPRLPLQDQERRRSRCSPRYTGRRAGHVQGRHRSRAEGRLAPDGFQVEPDGVMAKCPSRYEAARRRRAEAPRQRRPAWHVPRHVSHPRSVRDGERRVRRLDRRRAARHDARSSTAASACSTPSRR